VWPALILLVLCLASNALGQQQHTPIVLQDLGRATLPLDGDWQFHEGDDLAWASPGYNDSAWQPIQVGRSWEGQGHRNYTGFAWYRRRLVLPPGSASAGTLGLYLSGVDSACEVFWNGVRVGSYGKVPPDPVWYGFGFGGSTGTVVTLGPAQSGELAIRLWKAPTVFLNSPEEGGLLAAPVVGSAEAVAGVDAAAKYRRLRASRFSFVLAGVAGMVGVMALLLWLRDPSERMLLWLALAMVYPTANYFLLDAPRLPCRVAYGLIGPLISTHDMAMWFLLIALLGLKEHRRLMRWTWIVVLTAVGLDLIDSVCQLFDWTAWPPHRFLTIDVLSTTPAIYLEMWGFVLVFAAFGKRLDVARWMLAIAALLSTLLLALGDTSGLGQRWTHWTLANKLHGPLFTIAGTSLNFPSIVSAFLLMAILYSAWRYLVEHGQRQSALEQEMSNARAVQQVLIPDEIPSVPGFKIESVYKPAGEVGGDFFLILPTADNGVLAVIGDVSGKGMPAAMTVSLLVGTVHTLAHYTMNPGEILAAMNQHMLARSRGGFTTCLCARIADDGTLTLANAGHLAPYSNGEELPVSSGFPLGLVADAEYPEIALQLAPGETLTFLSDGVVEARNATGELFGFDRTQKISDQPAQSIAEAAQRFGQEDDITVVTLTLLPAAVLQS
jgi:hypothetical protein